MTVNTPLSPPDSSAENLHATVRDALAKANPAARAIESTLLQTPLDAAEPGLGPAALRRLYAFYAHGASSGLGDEQVGADLAWLVDHFDEWVARQEQAQQDARSLFETLRATHPLPAAGQRSAVPMLDQARALRRTPDHWMNQPWAQRLMGRWTEDLTEAVAEGRRWLDERCAETAAQSVVDSRLSG